MGGHPAHRREHRLDQHPTDDHSATPRRWPHDHAHAPEPSAEQRRPHRRDPPARVPAGLAARPRRAGRGDLPRLPAQPDRRRERLAVVRRRRTRRCSAPTCSSTCSSCCPASSCGCRSRAPPSTAARGRPGRVLLFRRMARLLPLYYTIVLVVWAVTNPSLPGHWQDLLLHLTFTHVYSDQYIFWTDGPAWSLGGRVPLLRADGAGGPARATPRSDVRRAGAAGSAWRLGAAGAAPDARRRRRTCCGRPCSSPSPTRTGRCGSPRSRGPPTSGSAWAWPCSAPPASASAPGRGAGRGRSASPPWPRWSMTRPTRHRRRVVAPAVRRWRSRSRLSAIVLHDGPWPRVLELEAAGVGRWPRLRHLPDPRAGDAVPGPCRRCCPTRARARCSSSPPFWSPSPRIALAWVSSRTVEAAGLRLLSHDRARRPAARLLRAPGPGRAEARTGAHLRPFETSC